MTNKRNSVDVLPDKTRDYIINQLGIGSREYTQGERPRPRWDTRWFMEAIVASKMSTCLSRAVGCVIVKNNIRIAEGHNGPPRNYPHPKKCSRKESGVCTGSSLDDCPCNHAEKNAITNLARTAGSSDGAIAYVTTKPCGDCMGTLINAGIKEVNFIVDYPSKHTDDLCEKTGVILKPISDLVLSELSLFMEY